MFNNSIHAEGERVPARLNGALRPNRAAWTAVCLVAGAAVCVALPLLASTHRKAPPTKSETAQAQFAHAEAMRQDLEGRPHGERTRLEYNRVMDAYRVVYHGDPASAKSPLAVTAVAELLAEEGRLFNERKPLEDAVGQYDFLRKQYPASPLRMKATLVEAEILDGDLGDSAAARARLQEFLKKYPHSDLAPQARHELATLGDTPTLKMADSGRSKIKLPTVPAIAQATTRTAPEPARQSARDASPVEDSAASSQAGETPLPAPAPEEQAHAVYAAGKEPPPAVLTEVSERQTPPAHRGGSRIMVTDIRHWSTPNYTRVAIDLGGEVRFQAGRASNPDRIYFDLYNTRLAPQLMGHLISVQGDAFLKDIRSAQYSQEITRVVLDVNSIAEYSAFLLPNPYRLIIDVHGRKQGPSEAHSGKAPTEGPGVDSDIAPAATTSTPVRGSARTARTARPTHTKPVPMPETVLGPVDVPKPDEHKTEAHKSAEPKSAEGKAAESKPITRTSENEKTEAPASESTANPPAEGTAAPAADGEKPAAAPAATDGSVDSEGHETGVSHPPSDVSTTPEDNQSAPQTAPQTTPQAAPESTPAPPTSDQQQPNLIKKPRHHATLPRQQVASATAPPQIIRATPQPTTQPVVDSVLPPKDDATDSPPFSRSVVPGAEPQSAASPDSAVSKAEVAKASVPDSAAGNSLTAPPIKGKHKKGKHGATAAAQKADPQLLEVREAQPTANGERSLVRALGLKIGRIVIDPGHGGHDSGTIGPDGIEEKDVVLDVGLRLGKLLRQRLGADVTFTRTTDTFVPLETRTAIANKAQADLFVSIHANSSRDASARGIETYYLNFTSSPDALDVAARENAVSEKSIHELQDLVKKIALKDKIDESKEFAADVDHSLSQGLGQNGAARDRGVKKAPFVVLIGANMPSILTEIAFVSNPQDAHDLRDPAYRERIAESLYAGIARYINGLSSVRVADATPHGAGN
jgi:N-acetylmuramoyl-L-alanine amidase